MPGKVWNDSGDDFEALVLELLRCKYGNIGFTEVPSGNKGDHGIEGFSQDGCVFQCYAADEPIDIPNLYAKQRDKISDDLRKFATNSKALAAIFGNLKIAHWILVVPRHESADLLIHATKKAKEIISQNLSYVDKDFKVIINTLENYKIERAKLVGALERELRLECEIPTPAQVDEWNEKNDNLLKTLGTKMPKLASFRALAPGEQANSIRSLVEQYVTGQNLLQRLLDDYPEVYQKVKKRKADREQLLTVNSLTQTDGQTHLKAELERLRIDLTNVLKGFDKHHIDQLVWEAIADWLLRCPLDFPSP